MYGIIDIGSNTIRLSCYRVVEKQLIHVFHKKSMVGLAGYVNDKKCLSEKGIQKAIDTLEDFKNIVMCVGLDKLYVIATASFRNVENTKEIVERIYNRTGIEVDVLSGKQEAMYDFKGATYGIDAEAGMVVDIGGGSTELVCYKDNKAEKAVSIAIGSLNMFSKFVEGLFPTDMEEERIRDYVKQELKELDFKKHKLVLGVGGTNRACAKLYNDYYSLAAGNTVMECEKIRHMLGQMRKEEGIWRNRILKIIPDRIHTIIPGMIVLDEINSCYKCKEVELSAWGVREGYMIEKVL